MSEVEIRRASYRDVNRVVAFLKTVFPRDDERYYSAFFQHDPWFDPELILMEESGGDVVATLFTLPRLFEEGERVWRAAGLANIATAEAYRGRGLASALMDQAVEDAARLDVDFLVLVTEIPRFYQRWGFVDVGKYTAGLPQPGEDAGRVRVERGRAVDLLAGGRDFARRFSLAVPFRNAAYFRGRERWNRWCSLFREGENCARWVRLSRGGQELAAYILERSQYLEVLDTFWGGDVDASEVLTMLGSLGSRPGKPVRVHHHRSVLEWLGLAPVRLEEAVMVLPRRDVLPDALYLPVPDYF